MDHHNQQHQQHLQTQQTQQTQQHLQTQQQQQQQQQYSFSRPIALNPHATSVATSPTTTMSHPPVPIMYSNNIAPINHHQHQQQNIATNPAVVSTAMNSQVIGQLMTNPALAAVAAATPLLPPAAMITNPGAFLTMPEYYRTQSAIVTGPPGAPTQDSQQQQITAKTSAAAINSSVAVRPQLVTAGQQVAVHSTQHQQQIQTGTTPQQQRHPQQQYQQQGQAQLFAIPTVQYPTILPYGVSLPNPVLALTPGVNPMAPSSVQVHMAANAAASQAIAAANTKLIPSVVESSSSASRTTGKRKAKDLSSQERAQQNRDRNREHARSTRLRKKAYVSKLKDLVDGLHRERTEEVRQRRVAIQHLAETQDVRRAVVSSFLRFHASHETDRRKWTTLLEDDFWLKQPVTPYRCFRRKEIQNESRITRGVEGMIADSSSMAVMIEGVGSRTSRWGHLKREEFIASEEERTGRKRMPRNIVQRNRQFRNAISSISASSCDSSNPSSSGEENGNKGQKCNSNSRVKGTENAAKNVSSSSNDSNNNASEDFHDYHAKPLPDPKLPADHTGQGSDSQEGSNSGDDTKRVIKLSGDDSTAAIKVPSNNGGNKRRRLESPKANGAISLDARSTIESAGSAAAKASNSYLPANMIAKKGGIAHNVRPVVSSVSIQKTCNTRLGLAPAVPLPPFAGIGKRPGGKYTSAGLTAFAASSAVSMSATDNANGKTENATIMDSNVALETPNGAVISGDVETSSSNSSRSKVQIRAYYHLNEDDIILMNDVIMTPFFFRTQDAILCGALSDCVMHGMLRGEFSSRNKLVSLEMVYDSMGLMQQLERCSGLELTAQIIPGSLEMALTPIPYESRVITLAEPPYLIINVNEAWTKLTKYTQLDAEGAELFSILDSASSSGSGRESTNSPYDLDDVSEGRCKCVTRFHYDKDNQEFVDFMCSYPLTNAKDEVTHILHISKELRSLEDSVEIQESDIGSSDANDEN